MFDAKPTLAEPYIHYWSQDPAFNTNDPDWDHEKWIETGDEKYIPTQGGRPVAFHMKHLQGRALMKARGLLQKVNDETYSFPLLAEDLVAMALHEIDGFFADGNEREVEHVTGRDGIKRVSPETMNILCRKPESVDELGMRVLREDLLGNFLSSKP